MYWVQRLGNWGNKCSQSLPSLVFDLLSSSDSPATPLAGGASLLKLSICCPGLLHSGVLLDTSDFGLDRDLGPDHTYQPLRSSLRVDSDSGASASESDYYWSLFDDLYYDTVYDASESRCISDSEPQFRERVNRGVFGNKRGKICRSWRSHLASGVWNFSRDEGSKLLARHFRDDCLYICDWPGCMHFREKRKYGPFRGVIKNFIVDFEGHQRWRE